MVKKYIIQCNGVGITPYRLDVSANASTDTPADTPADTPVSDNTKYRVDVYASAAECGAFDPKRTIMANNVYAGIDPGNTGGYNRKTVGNTVIVQFTDNGVQKMLYFCNSDNKVLEFVMPDGDVITKYYSTIGSDDIAYHQNQFREHKELSKIKRSISSIEPSIASRPIYYRSNKPTLLKLD